MGDETGGIWVRYMTMTINMEGRFCIVGVCFICTNSDAMQLDIDQIFNIFIRLKQIFPFHNFL